MKFPKIIAALSMCLLLLQGLPALAQSKLLEIEAVIVTKENVYQAERLTLLDPLKVPAYDGDKRVAESVPVDLVEKIVFGKAQKRENRQYNFSGAFVLKDGRRFEFINSLDTSFFNQGRVLEYQAPNLLSGEWETKRLSLASLAEIRIGDRVENLQYDSEGRAFPRDYIFSPYTGERLMQQKP